MLQKLFYYSDWYWNLPNLDEQNIIKWTSMLIQYRHGVLKVMTLKVKQLFSVSYLF